MDEVEHEPSGAPDGRRPWRLRDLSPQQRLLAGLVAAALLLIPALALARNGHRWYPQGDDALIEQRAREVGTARSPRVGQPSTSGLYGQGGEHVAHPGPAGFVAVAVGLRLFGPIWGTLGAMAAVAAGCLLLSVWVAFRRAGPAVGLWAAVLAAGVAFSVGAGPLLDPLSSNAARLPLLAAAVLVWGLLDGDLRLAPLAAVVWSYAAQQHLSVLPASAVVLGVGVLACAWGTWRPDPAAVGSRRQAGAWVGAALLVGLVVWAPVLHQEVTEDPGNLTAMLTYTGDAERENLGLGTALDQVAHVLGPRPFLGRSEPSGWEVVGAAGGSGTAVVLVAEAALLAAILWGTWRRGLVPPGRRRTLTAAVVVLGALVAAGLVTGANVPDSLEKGRLNFYHWAFSLSFLHLLVLGWVAGLVVGRLIRPSGVASGRAPARHPLPTWLPTAAAGAVALVCAVVALMPWTVDRGSDRLDQSIGTVGVGTFAETLADSPELRSAAGSITVASASPEAFVQLGDTIAVRLRAAGIDARYPPSSRGYVHPDHVLDPCLADQVLVLQRWWPGDEEPAGRLVVAVDGMPGLDTAALERLVAAAAGTEVELGSELESHLTAQPGGGGALQAASVALRLSTDPRSVLTGRGHLEALIQHPPVSPALSVEDLRAVRDSLEDASQSVGAQEFRAYLLTAEEFAATRARGPFPCVPR